MVQIPFSPTSIGRYLNLRNETEVFSLSFKCEEKSMVLSINGRCKKVNNGK